MAVKAQGADLVVALLLIVLGVLVLVGELSVGPLVPILGIILIVLGVLMLLGTVGGGTVWAVVFLVLGILLQLDWLDLSRQLTRVLNLAVGIALLVFGAMRLAGR